MLKKSRKILLIILIIGLVLSTASIFLIKNEWKNCLKEKDLMDLVEKVKLYEPLPNNFYRLYELAYPNSLRYGVDRKIRTFIIGHKYHVLPSEQVVILSCLVQQKYYRRQSLGVLSLAIQIERQTTQAECLNFMAKYRR